MSWENIAEHSTAAACEILLLAPSIDLYEPSKRDTYLLYLGSLRNYCIGIEPQSVQNSCAASVFTYLASSDENSNYLIVIQDIS